MIPQINISFQIVSCLNINDYHPWHWAKFISGRKGNPYKRSFTPDRSGRRFSDENFIVFMERKMTKHSGGVPYPGVYRLCTGECTKTGCGDIRMAQDIRYAQPWSSIRISINMLEICQSK